MPALRRFLARGTPSFLEPSGVRSRESIAEERWMRLGGFEQYVLIRGRRRDAPLLVFVHGGPGASETGLLRAYNADLEEDFVVAYWDQRGAGKSYSVRLDPSQLTLERITADLAELIDALRAELGHDKVLLVAHSWGTVPGLEHAAKRPDTLAAYVGVSQVTDQLASDVEAFEWALETARSRGDRKAMARLRALGKPPYAGNEVTKLHAQLGRLGGIFFEPRSFLDVMRPVLASPENRWLDLANYYLGSAVSMKVLYPVMQAYDAFAAHPRLDAPIFLVLGRHDHVISPRLGVDYLERVDAPDKDVLWLERSGHMLTCEEPRAFNDAIRSIAQRVGGA